MTRETVADTSWLEVHLPKVECVRKAKTKLLEKGARRGRARCPCGDRDSRTLLVWVNPQSRNAHVRAWCPECDFRLVE